MVTFGRSASLDAIETNESVDEIELIGWSVRMFKSSGMFELAAVDIESSESSRRTNPVGGLESSRSMTPENALSSPTP